MLLSTHTLDFGKLPQEVIEKCWSTVVLSPGSRVPLPLPACLSEQSIPLHTKVQREGMHTTGNHAVSVLQTLLNSYTCKRLTAELELLWRKESEGRNLIDQSERDLLS